MNQERATQYASVLSRMIQVETVSVEGVSQPEKFHRFHLLLQELFPHLMGSVEKEEFDGSLLLRWPGKTDRDPILLMSHHDVVEAGGSWTHPPFSGVTEDGRLWGRGTLDTKGSLFAMLQAAEELAAAGEVPPRDVWFVSTCTEETDGSGADRISAALQARGMRFAMVLDEGGMMLREPIGGAKGVFAMIGVGEKGCADLKFTARSRGGHASTPGKDTPLVRLGKFMAAADRCRCFRPELSPVTAELFSRMASGMSGALRFVFANARHMKWLLCKVMPRINNTAGAMLRTTLAFTMCGGSDGRNVLPREAWAVGNMRYSHHQGREDSIARIAKLAKKFDVDTQVLDGGFPSPMTDFRSEGFLRTERAVSAVFPGVQSVPYVMTAASDSRFFGRVSDCCIRFAPFLISDEQLDSIHGADENVDIATLPGAVDFYKMIIREEPHE